MPFSDRLKYNGKAHAASALPSFRVQQESMETRSKDEPLRDFIQLHKSDVPYISQSYSWDCGLACVEMALRARGIEQASFRELRKSCSTDSIWSIDIAYLLRSYHLNATFFTVTKGVRPEYRKQEFYRRQLPEDTKRVNYLFQNAERDGVEVIERPVLLSEIRKAISEDNNLVLVLMDKRLLKCSLCDRPTLQSRSVFPNRTTSGFLGHYVLLYAYHPDSDKFLMKDPAALRETCIISSDTLEEARLAFGTDQDVLFIGDVVVENYTQNNLPISNGS